MNDNNKVTFVVDTMHEANDVRKNMMINFSHIHPWILVQKITLKSGELVGFELDVRDQFCNYFNDASVRCELQSALLLHKTIKLDCDDNVELEGVAC